MKRISHKILTALLMLLPLAWQGCADDDYLDRPEIPQFQGIGVNIPYIAPDAQLSDKTRAALTRAGQDPDFDAGEAEIKSLYIFAFANGKTGITKAVKLTQAEVEALASSATHTGYKCYPFELEVGEYHVYLVANVDLGEGSDDFAKVKTNGTLDKDKLKAYNFASTSGALSAFSGGLPMSCKPEEVVGDDKNADNYVEVKSATASHISASLKFAVAKVRLTVINDATNGYSITKADVDGIADKLNLFSEGTDPTVTAKSQTMLSLGKYYDLPAMSDGKYQVDGLTGGQTSAPAEKWAWQGVFYVPERLTADATKMHLGFSSNATKDFSLGLQGNNGSTLVRSKYYRYNLTPASGSLKLQVVDWKPETILATLGGPVTLTVDKTDVGNVSGEAPVDLYYTSNVIPGYESPKYKGKDVFKLEPKTDDEGKTYFVVSVNPELGVVPSTDTELAACNYFYITAGPLKKKITAEPDLSAYLKVTPESYTVVMKEIVNQLEYSVEYTYTTNLDNLTYAMGGTDEAGSDLKYYIGSNQTTEVRPGTTTNLGKNGRIVVKFVEPYNPAKFQKESKIDYTFTATGSGTTLQETVKLNIVPNLNGYRLWFRDVDGSWGNGKQVHVYVYQPLDYNDNGKFIPTKTRNDWGKEEYEDAILYSFTGKHQFKGWSNVTLTTGDNGFQNKGSWIKWDQLNISSDNNSNNTTYYYITDFIEDFRKGVECTACYDANDDNKFARKWPGVAMKKMTGGPQDGWWYIDLPAICEPGKALIMFTNGHGGVGEQDRNNRYPLHLVPGIPLYDYADREGWMLYDPNDPNPQFVDDQPAVEEKYTIEWPKAKVGDNDCYQIKIINADNNSEITNGFVGFGGYTGTNESDYFWYKFKPSSENLRIKLAFQGNNNTLAYPGGDPDKVYTMSDFVNKTLRITSIAKEGSTPTPSTTVSIRFNWPAVDNYCYIDVTDESGTSLIGDFKMNNANENGKYKYIASIPSDAKIKLKFKKYEDGSITTPKGDPTYTVSSISGASSSEYSKELTITELATSSANNVMYLYLYDNQSGWGEPYAHCFTGGDNNGWPGAKMEHVSDNIWKVTVPSKYQKVIFSNNGSSQLGEVAIRNNGKYYSNNIGFADHYWE